MPHATAARYKTEKTFRSIDRWKGLGWDIFINFAAIKMLGTGVISFPFIFFVHSVVHQTIFLIEDGIRCIVTHKAPPHLLKVFHDLFEGNKEVIPVAWLFNIIIELISY